MNLRRITATGRCCRISFFGIKAGLRELTSMGTWRLIESRYYDLKFMRHLLRWWFLRPLHTANDPGKVGNIVVVARRDA